MVLQQPLHYLVISGNRSDIQLGVSIGLLGSVAIVGIVGLGQGTSSACRPVPFAFSGQHCNLR